MKRLFFLVLACILVFGFSSCKKSKEESTKVTGTEGQAVETAQMDAVQEVVVDEHVDHEHGVEGHDHGDIKAPDDVAAAPADAVKTKSGLAYKVLRKGTGGQPGVNDVVEVHYTGWTTDGKMFDSSKMRGEPIEFPVTGVIEGWQEMVQLMSVGEMVRVWIPENLAYKGRPGSPAGMLVFEIELLGVKKGPEVPSDVGAIPADAVKTKSGLAYKVLRAGKGEMKPGANDFVEVHYTGWTTEGKMFDSSEMRGETLKFSVGDVIAGWQEMMQLMSVGERVRAWIPEELAYKGRPGAPSGMLVFDMELIDVKKAPEAPEDVSAPPADAEKSASGLVSKILSAGTGTVHPSSEAVVKVHYSGWTTDGKLFDSSVLRGEPVVFSLGGVILGWTEGVQLMVVGEKRRFWIPEDLAYKGMPGAPSGMLVFDVELLSIENDKGRANAVAEEVKEGVVEAKEAAKEAVEEVKEATVEVKEAVKEAVEEVHKEAGSEGGSK